MKALLSVGEGVIDQGVFKGKIPYEDKTPVYLIEKESLEELLQNTLLLLLSNGREMTEDLTKCFPDCFDFTIGGKAQPTRQYLDRHMYSHDFSKQTWFRYRTLDEAFDQGEFYQDAVSPINDPEEDSVVMRDKINKGEYPGFKDNQWFDGHVWWDLPEDEDEEDSDD